MRMRVFETATLAGMRLANRIIRSATHEGLGDREDFAARLAERYIRLAQGGAGAIITGYAGVSRDGRAWPNMLMIDDDDYISAYRRVTEAVKPYGAPLVLQLAHAGGRAEPAVTGEEAKAPSRRRYKGAATTARELTEGEIERIIAAFAQGISRAWRSGFDGAQLHAAHGYLLAQFLSPALNRRRDRWGGSAENRFRIVREIVDRARQTVGDFPLLAKLSAYDYDDGGMRLEEAVNLAGLCREASLNAIEVSCGNDNWFCVVRSRQVPVAAILELAPALRGASWLKKKVAALLLPRLFPTYGEQENYNVAAAAAIKAAVDIPVLVVGGIRRLDAIEGIIAAGQADYVSLCRPFVIEPDIVARLRDGRQEGSRCINCNYCLIGVGANPLQCYYGRLPGQR
jgi:2,4-dienoyl-CoA reductase-like NADH-dependent reductase (Old Yellow Enzyme family)